MDKTKVIYTCPTCTGDETICNERECWEVERIAAQLFWCDNCGFIYDAIRFTVLENEEE